MKEKNKSKFRAFEEAREFARRLGIKNIKGWKKFCKSGEKPDDIPVDPNQPYKGKGWIDWYDFLGTNKDNFRPFEETREFVRSLGLKNIKDWREYCESGKRHDDDIPSAPNQTYKGKGWIDWYDFLGTNKIKFRTFEEAREFARCLGIKDWKEYRKSGDKPDDIPSVPNQTYKGKGWIGWYDFLGTNKDKFRAFEEAREFARRLGIKNIKGWKKFCKSGEKPDDIPVDPNQPYKGKGWIDWYDFLGTNKDNFRPFEETREFVRSLGLKNIKDWREYCESGKRHDDDIPSAPNQTYKGKGWIDWYDFLGTNKIKFRTFDESREFVRGLKLNSLKEWKKYIESMKKPIDIPSKPNKVYRNEGWINWYDFLGKTKLYFRSFEEAREFVRGLNMKSSTEWFEYLKLKMIPKDIPSTPNEVYKDKGWKNWPDFLGYLGNGNIWNRTSLITYLEYFKDSMNVLSTTQFIAIISSNGIDRYLKNDHLKKLQDTIPNSPERYTVVGTIIKEITEDASEELDIIDEEAITDQSINDILNNDLFLDDKEVENINELREKQLKALDTREITHSLDSDRVKFIVNL